MVYQEEIKIEGLKKARIIEASMLDKYTLALTGIKNNIQFIYMLPLHGLGWVEYDEKIIEVNELSSFLSSEAGFTVLDVHTTLTNKVIFVFENSQHEEFKISFIFENEVGMRLMINNVIKYIDVKFIPNHYTVEFKEVRDTSLWGENIYDNLHVAVEKLKLNLQTVAHDLAILALPILTGDNGNTHILYNVNYNGVTPFYLLTDDEVDDKIVYLFYHEKLGFELRIESYFYWRKNETNYFHTLDKAVDEHRQLLHKKFEQKYFYNEKS